MPDTDRSLAPLEQDSALNALVARVRDAHEAFLAAVDNALSAALDAGDAVLELQQELQNRGIGWQRWFEERGYLPLGTAKLYARLAAHRGEIEAERTQVPELSLRAARRLIAKAPTFSNRTAGAGGDVGPNSSTDETERLQARVDELAAAVRLRDIKITGLESEVDELKARAVKPFADDSLTALIERLREIITDANQPAWLKPLTARKQAQARKLIERFTDDLFEMCELRRAAVKARANNGPPTLDLKATLISDEPVTTH
jgi:hypothetical protein